MSISYPKLSHLALMLVCTSIAIFSTTSLSAQPIKEWDRGYGGSGWENCNYVQQTSDLGYILGGNTTSGISGDITEATRDDGSLPWAWYNTSDFWILRTDANGDVLWDARFGGNRMDILWGLVESTDGGYLLGGQSISDLSGDKTEASRGDFDYWIVKTDANGDYLWDRTYGGDSTDILNTLIQTSDGGYLLGGWSISSGWTPADSTGEKSGAVRGGFDWWVVKIDANGDIEWEQTYGGDGDERLNDMFQTADGGYVLGGGTGSNISGEVTEPSRGSTDFWILRIDADGNILDEIRYGGDEADELNEIIPTSDGGLFMGGSSLTLNVSGDKTDPGYGSFDWWVLKTDAIGTIEWQHTFGSDDMENVYSVSQNSVDHFLLGGFSRSADGNDVTDAPKGGFDFWMMYLDPSGAKLWDRRFGGDADDVMENLFQTNDGGYLLTGHSSTDVDQDKSDPSNGLNDFWVIKTQCNVSVELADTIVCPGDLVEISAYDPNCLDCVYSWGDDPNNTDSVRVVSTLTDVIYSVTLTDGVGCQKSDDINITLADVPEVELGPDQQICAGDIITLDAENPGSTYAWNTTSVDQTITVDTTGLYAVTVTAPSTCAVTDSIFVVENPLPVVDLGADTTICAGESVTLVAGFPGMDYNWNVSPLNQPSITVSNTGLVTVEVTDGNNCSATDQIDVQVIPLPATVDAQIPDPGPYCPGSDVDIIIENAALGITYQLFDGNDTLAGSALGNGGNISLNTGALLNSTSFSVIASTSLTCADTFNTQLDVQIGDIELPVLECPPGALITLEDNDCDPTLTTGAPVTMSDNCGVENLTYALSGATNADSPLSGINDAGDEVYEIGLTTVTYTATDTAGNTSQCNFTVEVIDMSLPLMGTAASDLTVECDGAGNLAEFNNWLASNAGATAFDACSNVTWTTDPINPLPADGCGESGSVTVTFIASDDGGNSIFTSATFTIQDTQAPTFTVPAAITLTPADDPNNLNLTGDVTDEADNCDSGVMDGGPREATFQDIVATNACEDIITRTWTLTDECGNTNEQTQIITIEYDIPMAAIAGNDLLCPGDTAVISFALAGNGIGFNVIYTDGLTNFSLPNIIDGHTVEVYPTAPTNYTLVEVIDLARPDCPATLSGQADIDVFDAPVVSSFVEECNELNSHYVVSFQITGGNPAAYSVTGDNGNLGGGFFASDPIERDSSYIFIIQDDSGCDPIVITGSYDCTCITEAGSILQNELIVCGEEVLDVENNSFNLDGNDVLLYLLHTGDENNIGPVVATYSNPNISFSNGLNYGTTYYLTAVAGTEDGIGGINFNDACLSTSVGVPIMFYEPPVATVQSVDGFEIDCNMPALVFNGVEGSNPIQTVTYEWQDENGATISTLPDASLSLSGAYLLIMTNTNSCRDTAIFNLTEDFVSPEAQIANPPLMTCYNDEVELNAQGSSTGFTFSYQWSGGNIINGATTLTPTVGATGTYQLIVLDNQNGCTAQASVNVEGDNLPPSVDAGEALQLDCQVESLSLNGSFTAPTNNVSIQWVSPNGNILSGANSLTPLVNTTGNYTLQVTNLDNGCMGSDLTEVVEPPDIPQDIVYDFSDPDCYGEESGSINIISIVGGVGPYTYSVDGFYSGDTLINNLGAGTYGLSVLDANGCTFETPVTLMEPDEFLVELGPSQQILLGDSILLEALSAQFIADISWAGGATVPCDSCTQVFVQPTNSTSYAVVAENLAGCIARDAVNISVLKDRNIYIPTAFSPDGDGMNDFFAIYSDQSVETIEVFRVYNRWGALVYEARDMLPNAEPEGWDGSFKGEKVDEGVYIFYAEIVFTDGWREIYNGDVTLLR